MFLASTLFINLLSHFPSSRYNEKTIQDLDDEINYDDLISNINKKNKIVSNLNLASIIFLGLEILFILIFTTLNPYNSGKQNNQNTQPSKPNKEERSNK